MSKNPRRGIECSTKNCHSATDGAVYCDVHAEAHARVMAAKYRAKNGRAPCKRCGSVLPLDAGTWRFRLCETCRIHPAPSAAPGYRRRTRSCQRCSAPLDKKIKWCQACTAEAQHRGIVARTFGIERDEYDRLQALQSGRCAICLALPGRRRLAVDHDHETGAVRGLLCNSCNRGLGSFSDSRGVLHRAMAYLAEPPAVSRKPVFPG